MTPDKELERVAREYSTFDGELEDDLDFKAHDQYVGFKAGAHFERQRILELLRSEKAFKELPNGRMVIGSTIGHTVADFIEQSLNETKKENEGG